MKANVIPGKQTCVTYELNRQEEYHACTAKRIAALSDPLLTSTVEALEAAGLFDSFETVGGWTLACLHFRLWIGPPEKIAERGRALRAALGRLWMKSTGTSGEIAHVNYTLDGVVEGKTCVVSAEVREDRLPTGCRLIPKTETVTSFVVECAPGAASGQETAR